MDASPRGKLNANDWRKIGMGLAMAVVGAILTYVTEALPNVELGSMQPVVMAGWSVLANLVRKWITDNAPKEEG